MPRAKSSIARKNAILCLLSLSDDFTGGSVSNKIVATNAMSIAWSK